MNPGESKATEVTVNASSPVFVMRTWTRPPTASSVRSRTASASSPGTAGILADVSAGDDEGAAEGDGVVPQAAVTATRSPSLVRLTPRSVGR
jgi:hypothetical protein